MSEEPLSAEELGIDQQPEEVKLSRWVTFRLADETYGINVTQTQEVLRITEIAPVPGAPPFVLGIINLRGNVVTVIDMRMRLGLPTKEIDDASRIVILEGEDDEIAGILVDSIAEVVELNEYNIEPPPNTGQNPHADIISGVIHQDNELIILLEPQKLLSENG